MIDWDPVITDCDNGFEPWVYYQIMTMALQPFTFPWGTVHDDVFGMVEPWATQYSFDDIPTPNVGTAILIRVRTVDQAGNLSDECQGVVN